MQTGDSELVAEPLTEHIWLHAPLCDSVCQGILMVLIPSLEVQPDMRAFRLLSECPLPTEEGEAVLRIYGDETCSPWPVGALGLWCSGGAWVGAPVRFRTCACAVGEELEDVCRQAEELCSTCLARDS